jgi:hypothetical protein
LDFAANAIEQARQRHPEQQFLRTESGEIPGQFDVILTSNSLEHFENPLEIVRSHLDSCKDLYILLVPYNETPLSEHHKASFTEESFPEDVGRFARLCAKRIDVNPSIGTANNFLLYGSELSATVRFAEKARSKLSGISIMRRCLCTEPTRQPDPSALSCRASFGVPEGRQDSGPLWGGWQSLALARSGKFQVA